MLGAAQTSSGRVGTRRPVAVTPLAEAPVARPGQGVEGTDPPFWAGQGCPTADADGIVGNNDFTPCRRPTGKMGWKGTQTAARP